LISALVIAACLSFVDDAGRRVTVPPHPTRVIAAGPPAAVWIYALAPDALAGWTRAFKDEEAALIPEPYKSLPVIGYLTGHRGTASLESLAARKPDLLIDVGTVDPTHAALADRVQAQTGIPYVLIGGTLSESGKTFRRLGELLGRQAQAEELAVYVDALVAKASAAVSADPHRPKVYLARGPRGLETTLASSLFAEVIRLAGAENIAASGTTDAIVTVSFETVARATPAVIVTQDGNFAKLAGSDPAWKALGARVLLAPKVPFGWIDSPPSVNRVLGLLWLTGELHPLSWDATDTVRTFYERVFHVRLTSAQVEKVLHP
jgi:iron complex transport system substrate-binding protein